MFKDLFILLLVVHAVGDFYLTDANEPGREDDAYPKILCRALVYGACFATVLLIIHTTAVVLAFAVMAAAHIGIETVGYLRVWFKRRKGKKVNTVWAFAVGQLAHLGVMAIIAYVFVHSGYEMNTPAFLRSIAQTTGINAHAAFRWTTLILLAHKPINTTIKTLMSTYKPVEQGANQNDRQAGAFIGTLERLIILVLLSMGQYAMIGLVLTAKSIARFKRIQEDQGFAEYYLIGTLLSTLLSILLYLAIS